MTEQRETILGHVYSLFAWDTCNFVSASQDGTVRLWDIRQPDCINVIAPRPSSINNKKAKEIFFYLKFNR